MIRTSDSTPMSPWKQGDPWGTLKISFWDGRGSGPTGVGRVQVRWSYCRCNPKLSSISLFGVGVGSGMILGP
ncbi:hypothetical protein [Pasteuria penetrans]|uniref:hypothetical protein n=1 Tax=Pasteuria penetrans TaxID=86005 RepID=UPI000F9D2D4A|nr:hypothetical protein [Pasteuria penetrans]